MIFRRRRTPAAFWRGIAVARLYVPFCLQTIESGVNGADGYFSVRAKFDLLSHGYSIGAIFQPQKCQDNDMFEFAKVVAFGHYIYNIE